MNAHTLNQNQNQKNNTMDTNVMRQKLFFDTDTVLHEDTSIATPLYVENTALIISPLITTIREATVVFLLDNIFYFDNTGNTVTELQIDFDDGLGFRSVMFNDAIPITYPHEGEKTLCFRTVFANGDTLIAYALLNYFSMPQSISFLSGYPYIDRLEGDEAITAKISHPNAYTGGNFSLNKGDVWIYYANSDKQLRKPVLIVDGFDPGNKRRIEEKKDDDANKTIWEMLYYDNSTKHIGLELLLKGYDLVILDLPDGGGYIEQNAMVCIEVINKINQLLDISGSKEEIVIIGPSMGGQITRYALAYMEQHSEDPNTNFGKHNCRLWVSFDSPHQGANISMGAQAFIHYFEALDKAKEIWEKTLNCPAAQQMLIYHKANTGGKFSTYYTNLSNIGYPNNLRKIAVANGSLNGTSNGSAKDLVLKMVAPYVVLNLDARIWLSPSYGEKNKVFQASWIVFIPFIFSPPSLCIPAPITWEVTAPSNFCSIDAAPGGYYNTFKQFEGVTNIAVIDIYRYNHCFMPIPSVLDLSGDLNYCTDISNRNMVADNMTPFDAYWGPINKNMEHVSFDQELVDWLFNEVETYIEGERSIPVCEIQSYTLHLPSGKENTNVTWYCSSNLKIVAGKNSNTVLIKATGKGDAWIYAEVDNLTHSQKLSKFYITTTDANMYENAPLLFAGNYEWNQPWWQTYC
jgi:pimeloyl-ACP methyl ester carboxylesterase